MARLILYSGGVESTALLTIAYTDDIVMIVDCGGERPTYDNRTTRIPGLYGLNTEWWDIQNDYTRRAPSTYRESAIYQLHWLLAAAGIYCEQHPDITEVWYGMHAGEPHADRVQEPFKQLCTAWSIVHPATPLRWPLYHLTKAQQWNLIPDNVKKLVRNCTYGTDCGQCTKCSELKVLPGSFWCQKESSGPDCA